jgi:hypothetical protein
MKLTGDLQSAKLMYLKAVLFLVIGLLSVTALLLDSPTLRTAFLLLLTIWSFCRLYYFFFYVIEKYVDPTYKFAGLHSFLTYAWQQGRARKRR